MRHIHILALLLILSVVSVKVSKIIYHIELEDVNNK